MVVPEPGETLFLYLAASAEAVSMVLVAERMEQPRQGDTRVSPAKDGEPDPGHGGLAATPLSEDLDPGQGGPEEPHPSGNPELLGAQGPGVVDKGEPDPVARVRTIQKPVYYVSEVLHEAKARYLCHTYCVQETAPLFSGTQSCRSDLLSAERSCTTPTPRATSPSGQQN